MLAETVSCQRHLEAGRTWDNAHFICKPTAPHLWGAGKVSRRTLRMDFWLARRRMPVPGCEPPRTLFERLSGRLLELGVFEMLRRNHIRRLSTEGHVASSRMQKRTVNTSTEAPCEHMLISAYGMPSAAQAARNRCIEDDGDVVFSEEHAG